MEGIRVTGSTYAVYSYGRTDSTESNRFTNSSMVDWEETQRTRESTAASLSLKCPYDGGYLFPNNVNGFLHIDAVVATSKQHFAGVGLTWGR